MVRRRARAGASTKSPSEVMANGTTAALTNAAELLEDQYFASPKRKDCKTEDSLSACDVGSGHASGDASPNSIEIEEDAIDLSIKLKASSPSKMRGERTGCGVGRTIGVPLATRSQTRTIENFFKANVAAKQNKQINNNHTHDEQFADATETQKSIQPTLSASVISPQMTQLQQHIEQQKRQINGDHNYQQQQQQLLQQQPPIVITRRSLDHVVVPQEFIFDLSEDTNDSEQTDLSEETTLQMVQQDASGAVLTNGFDFTTHRSSQRADSHSSSHSSSNTSATENIFLQEPVLTLNVDKSPNQASSIVINKTLEVEPKFSSPTSVLQGRFNQIALNTSPSKRDSLGYEKKPLELNCHDYALLMLPENDNSSCDSGVAFHTTITTSQSNGGLAMDSLVQASPATATNRRRKPATPHRIVCPSPIKAPPRVISPALSPSSRKMASALSPRKSQRHVTTTAMAAATGGAVVMPAPNKTRRRLNPAPTKEQESALDKQENHVANSVVVRNNADDAIIVSDDEDDDVNVDEEEEEEENEQDIECENMASNVTDMKLAAASANANKLNGMKKSILNSAKHPTNQQNATNNRGKSKAQHKTKYTVQRSQHATLKHQATQPLAATNGNREINEFFPVRRSVRKTKTAVKEEQMRNLEQAILEERCEGLTIAHFENKGRGIISQRRFQRGEFVIEYVGDLISTAEAAEREKRYALDENAGCYMYYFKHKNQQYCIDATEDTGKLGRLVNHSRNGNLGTKVVVVKQKPHLVLIAKDDIEAGEELCYDYGDRSKESLLHHPWLAF